MRRATLLTAPAKPARKKSPSDANTLPTVHRIAWTASAGGGGAISIRVLAVTTAQSIPTRMHMCVQSHIYLIVSIDVDGNWIDIGGNWQKAATSGIIKIAHNIRQHSLLSPSKGSRNLGFLKTWALPVASRPCSVHCL